MTGTETLISYLYIFQVPKGADKTKEKHHVARALLELSSEQGPEFTATPLYEDNCVAKPLCEFMSLDDLPEPENLEIACDPVTESQVNSELQRLITENMLLKEQVNAFKYTKDAFAGQDDKVKYYTGLPSYHVLISVFDLVKSYIPKPKGNSDLGQFERFAMTLMRLKLNLAVQDLAYRFQTSTSTVSRTFLLVIHVLFMRLKHTLYWPERDELRRTMPL